MKIVNDIFRTKPDDRISLRKFMLIKLQDIANIHIKIRNIFQIKCPTKMIINNSYNSILTSLVIWRDEWLKYSIS